MNEEEIMEVLKERVNGLIFEHKFEKKSKTKQKIANEFYFYKSILDLIVSKKIMIQELKKQLDKKGQQDKNINEEIYKLEEMEYNDQLDVKTLCFGTIDNYDFKILSYSKYPCAYVKLPKHNKYYAKNYDEIDISVHGGLTYSEFDDTGYWIGWDYAHYGDYIFSTNFLSNDKKYNVDEILNDVKNVIKQIGKDQDND